MADEHDVKIVGWPQEAARLEHHFETDNPCPVSISFEETPADVILNTTQPLDVNMNMRVAVREAIPLCIKICEPICARSNYTIGINIFNNPFASISVRGTTRLFNCDEQPAVEPRCVNFQNLELGTEFAQPFTVEKVTFIPLGAPLRTATFGDPIGRIKLAFPRTGVRIEFAQPVEDIKLTVNNYAGETLEFTAYSGTVLVVQFSEPISNNVKEVAITQTGVTAVEISGGDNEASVIEVCFTLAERT